MRHDPQTTHTFSDVSRLAHITRSNLICILDENHGIGDSSDGLWSMYLSEAEKEDKEVTENWKGDTDGILVFVSPATSILCMFTV